MDRNTSKLAEKMLLFLYSIKQKTDSINQNTFKRYLYMYYVSSDFINGNTDDVDIIIDKGDITIVNFDGVMYEFIAKEYIEINDNSIVIRPELLNLVVPLLKNTDGAFYKQYREIQPFINLLLTYTDQFIFTIFFHEPTFKEASLRGTNKMQPVDSQLDRLLKQFQSRIKDKQIDEYDILTYWMDFILKNYYNMGTGENSAK